MEELDVVLLAGGIGECGAPWGGSVVTAAGEVASYWEKVLVYYSAIEQSQRGRIGGTNHLVEVGWYCRSRFPGFGSWDQTDFSAEVDESFPCVPLQH